MSSNDNQPSKASGQYHSAKGSVVEAIGNATGMESWQKSGSQEHAKGSAEHNAAKAQGYAEGTKDRLTGYKDSIIGAVTGDKEQQVAGNVQKEKGTAQQEINKP